MDKEKVEKLIAGIRSCYGAIGTERDKLRDLISEAEDVLYKSDEAVRALENVADSLSEYM